jgi:hypothetical protein
VGLIAARQRLRITWPAIGAVLLALIGCGVRVNASHPASGSAAGHVSLSFGLGPDIGGTLVYALAILSLAALPYLVWRVLQRAAA